jgi:hypothetical protein
MADLPTNYAGTVKVTVRERDYYVHMTAPMPMMPLDDLKTALDINREIIKQSQDQLREMFIKEAFEYAAPWQVNYDAPIQNAIQAHININMLIPLINMKGGKASFEKPETLNVQTRIETMRTVAEKTVFMEHHMARPNTVNTAFAVTVILLLLLSLSLI